MAFLGPFPQFTSKFRLLGDGYCTRALWFPCGIIICIFFRPTAQIASCPSFLASVAIDPPLHPIILIETWDFLTWLSQIYRVYEPLFRGFYVFCQSNIHSDPCWSEIIPWRTSKDLSPHYTLRPGDDDATVIGLLIRIGIAGETWTVFPVRKKSFSTLNTIGTSKSANLVNTWRFNCDEHIFINSFAPITNSM